LKRKRRGCVKCQNGPYSFFETIDGHADALPILHALTVVALVRRIREDVTDPYFARDIKYDSWEIPICETIFLRG